MIHALHYQISHFYLVHHQKLLIFNYAFNFYPFITYQNGHDYLSPYIEHPAIINDVKIVNGQAIPVETDTTTTIVNNT
eukprot:UN05458